MGTKQQRSRRSAADVPDQSDRRRSPAAFWADLAGGSALVVLLVASLYLPALI